MTTLRHFRTWLARVVTLGIASGTSLVAQEYGVADRESPGDVAIQHYLASEATAIDRQFVQDLSKPLTESAREDLRREYRYMLGLEPLPPKTPLAAQTVRTRTYDEIAVEMVHFQSQPGLYVTGNLYRPATVPPGTRLPAILYVCGHAGQGVYGNKVSYQSHGMWFAKHGFVCLMIDTLQLGEIGSVHHGTYRFERWWWLSRGYTPAGVEAWNGVRAIDYLLERSDVDSERLGVTGISGGGAATFWIAALDPRARIAAPVSGMADLESYVGNRVINGHCDCMFMVNTFRWPWTRIAALIAPRPLLFVNSDQDAIFPMDANERIAARLERVYSHLGASEQVDAVVSVGGHDYRTDIRAATFQFARRHLQHDGRPVEDADWGVGPVDSAANGKPQPLLDFESLRVFRSEAELPRDQRNTTIDEQFVPLAPLPPTTQPAYDAWRENTRRELRRVVWAYLPDGIPTAERVEAKDAASSTSATSSTSANKPTDTERLRTEQNLTVSIRYVERAGAESPTSNTPNARPGDSPQIVLAVLQPDEAGTLPEWISPLRDAGHALVLLEPRGVGDARWTRRSPPNYIERSHVLLGRTVDTGRLWDVVATAEYLRRSSRWRDSATRGLVFAGRGGAGLVAAYAALLDTQSPAVYLVNPPATHMAADAPPFLNILRVADVPAMLGLLAPRRLTCVGGELAKFAPTAQAYTAVGATESLQWRAEP